MKDEHGEFSERFDAKFMIERTRQKRCFFAAQNVSVHQKETSFLMKVQLTELSQVKSFNLMLTSSKDYKVTAVGTCQKEST